jgi:hypothetical protein
MTYTAPWIGNIAQVPWYYVNMKVINGLAGRGTGVEPNIVAIRLMDAFDGTLYLLNTLHQPLLDGLFSCEPVLYVLSRND